MSSASQNKGAIVVYMSGGAATGKTTMCAQLPKQGVLVADPNGTRVADDAVLEMASKNPSVKLVIIVSNKRPPPGFARRVKANGMQPFFVAFAKDAKDAARLALQKAEWGGFDACNIVHRADDQCSAWTNAFGPPGVRWAAGTGVKFKSVA